MNQFAIRLKKLRIGADISQRKLSTDLGLNKMAIRDMENCSKLPSRQTIKQIAEYFGEDYDSLENDVYKSKLFTKHIVKIYEKRN